MWSAMANAAISTATVKAQAVACAAKRRNWPRNNTSAHTATAVFSSPKNKPVRISPRCGTSSNGKATDTTSAPR